MARQPPGKLDSIVTGAVPRRRARLGSMRLWTQPQGQFFDSATATEGQQVARAAQAAAAGAQTTADGKNAVGFGATPPTPAVVNDMWFNGDTIANCPDNNCSGHTLDVNGVPNVGAFPHRKLWWVHRYNGTAWVDAIGVGAVAKGDLVDGAVVSAKLADLAVTLSKLQDGAVSNAKLVNGAVDALKLADAAVSAAKLLAGAVDVTKLAQGQGLNFLPNGDFSAWDAVNSTPLGWADETYLWTILRGVNLNASWSLQGNTDAFNQQYLNTLWVQTAVPQGAGYSLWRSPPVPVVAGKRYVLSVYSGAHRCTATVGFYFYDSTGAFVGTGDNPAGDDNNAAASAGGPTLAGYKRIYKAVDAPATATQVKCLLYKGDTYGGQVDSYVFWCRAQFEEVGTNASLPGPWVPPAAAIITTERIVAGAVTTGKLDALAVTAAKIAAGAIETAKLAAGAVTTNELAAGAVTTPKLSAGAVTANELAALSVIAGKIAAGAVTATEIAAGAVTTIKLAALAVTANELAASAVTTDKLAANAVTAAKIAAATITAAELAAGAVTAAKIAAGAVTAATIAADALATSDFAEAFQATPKLEVPSGGVKLVASSNFPAWQASTIYAQGDIRKNGNNLYVCTTAGTSAAAGGPTGTDFYNEVTDNTAKWKYYPQLRIGPGGAQVGSYLLSDTVVASLTALARSGTSASDLAWYRGNNDPNTNSGRPGDTNLSITLQQQVAMSGFFWLLLELNLLNNTSNLDGLRYVKCRWFRWTSGAPVEYRTYYWPIPDRRYEVPGTPSDALNKAYSSVFVYDYAIQGFRTSDNPRVCLLVSLYGPNAHSAENWHYYNGNVAESYAMGAVLTNNGTTCPLGTGGPGGGGGGGSGGGSCPAPEVGVLLADGSYRPAGLLQVGDRIWTIPGGPSAHKEPGEYAVTAIEVVQDSERLALALDDGTRLVYSPRHLVMTPSGWCAVQNLRAGERLLTIHGERRVSSVLPAARGQVVRITTSASTYVTEGGVLNHNLKGQ